MMLKNSYFLLIIKKMSIPYLYLRIGLVCFWLVNIAVYMTSLAIGLNYADDECLKKDVVGINLSEWLIGGAIGGLIVNICFFSFANYYKYEFYEINKTPKKTFYTIAFWNCVTIIFGIIYGIIGIFIYFRSSEDCVNNPVGIMGLILWIYFILPPLVFVAAISLIICPKPTISSV